MKIEIKEDGELVRVLKEIKEGLSQLAEAVSSRADETGSQERKSVTELRQTKEIKSPVENDGTGQTERTELAVGREQTDQTGEVSKLRKKKSLTAADNLAVKADTAARNGIENSSLGDKSIKGNGKKILRPEEQQAQKEAEKQSQPGCTIQELRAVLAQLPHLEAKKLLSTYGVSKLTELPAVHYDSLMRKAGGRLC